MSDTTIITSVYYNIEGHPHYGVHGKKNRYLFSLKSIATQTTLPIICYTSEKYGCYDDLQKMLSDAELDNVTLKVRELEDMLFHDEILSIRLEKDYKKYDARPINLYWQKMFFMLENIHQSEYVYWLDAGIAHNGMFPKKYAYLDHKGYGFTDYECTFAFTCFSDRTFKNANEFAQDRVVLLVKQHTDSDMSVFSSKLRPVHIGYPVAGFFGGYTKNSMLAAYLFECIAEMKELLSRRMLVTEEGVMAQVYAQHPEIIRPYWFDNFYSEDDAVELRISPDGRMYHQFYRFFCDEQLLTDARGIL